MFSIWEKESFYASQDVIIIGAGLMGLWSALELKKQTPLLRITILEKNTTPLGASTRNAGFACFGSPTELLHDIDVAGESETLAVAEMRYKGIEKIRKQFTDNQIGYEACGGFECIYTQLKGYEKYNNEGVLKGKLEYLNKVFKYVTNKEETFKRADDKIGPLGLTGFDVLLENTLEASLHSGKLVQALSQKVQSMGIQILTGIEVHHLEESSGNIIVHTPAVKLSAKQVLCCTNAFTKQLLPDVNIIPGRGQVIVTSPIPNLTMKGTFHFDEGFYYWRNLGDRILLGGARNKSFEEETTTQIEISTIIQQELEHFLATRLASQYNYTIEYRWGGIMAFTENKLPIVTEVAPGIFAAVACNGMGVALTPMIAEQVAKVMS